MATDALRQHHQDPARQCRQPVGRRLGGVQPGRGREDELRSQRDPASQIASNTRSNDAYSWTGHGSGTTSTTADGRNQIAGWVSTLGYDSKGNVTSHGTYTYTYSSENLLTSLANSASGAIQASSTYAYDPLMRLAVIDSSNSGLDASLGYDGQDFILEGLSGSRTRRHVRGPGVDEPLAWYEGSGTRRRTKAELPPGAALAGAFRARSAN